MTELLPVFINIEYVLGATFWGIHHYLRCSVTLHPPLQDQPFSVLSRSERAWCAAVKRKWPKSSTADPVMHVSTHCAQILCMICHVLRCNLYRNPLERRKRAAPLAPSLQADSTCSDLRYWTPTPALRNITGFCRLVEARESDNRIKSE